MNDFEQLLAQMDLEKASDPEETEVEAEPKSEEEAEVDFHAAETYRLLVKQVREMILHAFYEAYPSYNFEVIPDQNSHLYVSMLIQIKMKKLGGEPFEVNSRPGWNPPSILSQVRDALPTLVHGFSGYIGQAALERIEDYDRKQKN